MSGIIGEVEFEFREDSEGGGEFLACGKVVNHILTRLARNDVDEAASIFASCAENVGDQLIAEATGGGASKQTVTNLAQMFFKARDFARAARCAELGGQPELAAKYFEANYDNARAAAYYLKADNHLKAAELLERDLDFARAAELYVKARDLPRAAECFERASRFYLAGQVYAKISRWDRALTVLQKVEPASGHWVQATALLGRILEKTGNQEAAMHRYLEVVKSRPIDEQSVQIHFRLGTLLAQKGYHPQAEKLLGGVLKMDPDHEGARRSFAMLPGRSTTVPAAQAESLPSAGDGEEPAPLDLGVDAPQQQEKDRIVGVDRDFEFLRKVELLRELSLDELKFVQSMCRKKRFEAGQELISQSTPGQALYVIARGTAAVTTRSAGGEEKTLTRLGPGAYVGEMALLDDALTSAGVRAETEVNAYVLDRRRFNEIMSSNERIEVRIYRVLISTLLARLREANAKIASSSTAPSPGACPSCGGMLEEPSAHCPHCGKPVRTGES